MIDFKEKRIKNARLGYLEGIVSLVVNTLLFIIKLWAGIVSGSVALVADAWHTLSDSFTSLVVIIGFKMTEKPADKEHPFGHGRFEIISTLIIGVVLVVVGFNFLIDSIHRLFDHQEAKYGTLAIVATIISLIVKEATAQFSIRLGKKNNLQSLIADGWHHRSDAISSALILIGIFIGKYYWWIDGVLGIAVALLIFYTSFDIIKTVFSPLLGEKPDDELIQKVYELSDKIGLSGLNIHHERLHVYGYHKELTFHIELPGDMTLNKAHQIANRLENIILIDLGIYATIHMEPEGTFESHTGFRIIKFNFSDNYHFRLARTIRNEVFVKEQNVDPDLEFDGYDQTANHYLGYCNNKPVCVARWRKTEKGIKLERFAVLKEFRNKGLAALMLKEILDDVRYLNEKIYLHAQELAVNFYKKHDFVVFGEKFVEAGIDHYYMEYKPDKDE
ncbi:MAG: hypothetical protein Kow0068_16110 [Marinilabiliales bacterium]